MQLCLFKCPKRTEQFIGFYFFNTNSFFYTFGLSPKRCAVPARYSRYIPVLSLTGDFILLNLFFVIGYCMLRSMELCLQPIYILFFSYLNLCWLILVFSFGAHKTNRNTQKKSILFVYIRIIVFFFFFFLMFFQLTPMEYYSRDFIKYLFPMFFLSLIILKFGLYYAFLLYRRWGFNFRNVIIIGYSENTEKLANFFMNKRWHGYRFLGFFDDETQGSKHIIGCWSDLKKFFENNLVHEVYLAGNKIPSARMREIVETISDYPVQMRIVPELGDFSYKSAELVDYGVLPVIKIHPGPLSYWYNQLIKRAFDIFLSLIVILGVLSWMIPVMYVITLFGSREGVFFKQARTALDGKTFTCIKFRSMRKNHLAHEQQATENDDRVTPVGRFLRKFSLDELPQFFNVLLGQMSVVGPRPHMLKHTEEYRKLVKRFMLRHTVKPGITGLAQVNGYRGEIKNDEDIQNRFKFDVRYIETWSFNLDIKIILVTIWLILRGRLWAY
jgi:putative colanic acid biosysnthesis UDP-glucose lipid carrier transferase